MRGSEVYTGTSLYRKDNSSFTTPFHWLPSSIYSLSCILLFCFMIVWSLNKFHPEDNKFCSEQDNVPKGNNPVIMYTALNYSVHICHSIKLYISPSKNIHVMQIGQEMFFYWLTVRRMTPNIFGRSTMRHITVWVLL